MGHDELIKKAGAVIQELFNFDGQVEELCAMSEMEGQFGMDANTMIDVLRQFAAYATSED